MKGKVLLTGLLALVVLVSGCLGGGSTKTTHPHTGTPTPATVEVRPPKEIASNGLKLSFSVSITGNASVSKVIGLLEFGGKTLNLGAGTLKRTANGYEASFSYELPPGTGSITTTATLKVIVYTDKGTVEKDFNVPLKVKITPPKVRVSLFPMGSAINVSELIQNPLTLVMKVSSDTNGVIVVRKVTDDKGFVKGITGFTTFPFKKGTASYYIDVSYDPEKVLKAGGGADRVTVEGYYYQYSNPSMKFLFKATTEVVFRVEQLNIDFTAFRSLTVLGAGYIYNKTKDYALVEVTFVAPTGLAKAVKYTFSVSTAGMENALNGLYDELVAVNGYVNVTRAFSVFEAGKPSKEAVITVPSNNTVVTLLIKAKKMPVNTTNVARLIKSGFYVVVRVDEAETESGSWVSPNEVVTFKQPVRITGVVDVGKKCSCSPVLSGVLAGFTGLYTTANPERRRPTPRLRVLHVQSPL